MEHVLDAFYMLLMKQGKQKLVLSNNGFVPSRPIRPRLERIIITNGFKGEPIYMPRRPQEVKMATCSADKARKLLGYKTKTKLDDGLNTMVDWIRQTGPREFRYHLDIENHTESLPDTWAKKLM